MRQFTSTPCKFLRIDADRPVIRIPHLQFATLASWTPAKSPPSTKSASWSYPSITPIARISHRLTSAPQLAILRFAFNSSGQEATGRLLELIADARAHGVDVSTEAYPYTAGATRIDSALFDSWMDKLPADYQPLPWNSTGERLTRERFLKYRKRGGLVITHANTEERVRTAILSPLTMIASDGFDVVEGQGHPRSGATFSRVLAKYVREEKSLSLICDS